LAEKIGEVELDGTNNNRSDGQNPRSGCVNMKEELLYLI